MLYYPFNQKQSAALTALEDSIRAFEFDDTLDLPLGVTGYDVDSVDSLRECIAQFQQAWDLAVPLPCEEDIEEEDEDVELEEDDVE